MVATLSMKNIFFVIVSMVLMVSCGKRDGFEFIETQSRELRLENKLITFQDLQNRIIVPHCISCHKRSGTEEGIEKWIIAGDPENSKMFKVIRDGTMPKKADPLSTADLEFVRQYIIDLATIRNLETVDFDILKNEILVPHCLNCHKRADNEEGIQRWIDPNDPMSSRLLQAVVEGKMPKKAAPLNEEQQSIIIKYLNNFLK